MACKMFKINKHEDINKNACSAYNHLASYECFQRIYQTSETVELFSFPKDVLKFSLGQAKLKGHIIEAGVYYGQSINLKKERKHFYIFLLLRNCR